MIKTDEMLTAVAICLCSAALIIYLIHRSYEDR